MTKGLYFSGTGNTKHCVEAFVRCIDANSRAFSIETQGLDRLLADATVIVFGHPTCFSNAPKMVRDFILNHKAIFHGKEIFIIATMGLFSGDGAGCSARHWRGNVYWMRSLHQKLPDEKSSKKGW